MCLLSQYLPMLHTSYTSESSYYCLVILDNMCPLSQLLSVIHTSCTSESSYYTLVLLDNMCQLSQVQSVIPTSCISESSHYCLVHLDKKIHFVQWPWQTDGQKGIARSWSPSDLKTNFNIGIMPLNQWIWTEFFTNYNFPNSTAKNKPTGMYVKRLALKNVFCCKCCPESSD